MLDILIPTYGRADRLERIVTNVAAATSVEYTLTFAVEVDDTATLEKLDELGVARVTNKGPRSYAGAINTAYRQTSQRYLFAGADDVLFYAGWDRALELMDGWFTVVGTNDQLNVYVLAGSHATHYFVDRTYLDEIGGVVDEGPGSFLHEGYTHQYVDTEFIGTAKMRARFRPCFTSIVEHVHAYSQKEYRAAPDSTTAKAFEHADEDSRLYDSRRDLWFSISR